MPPFFLNSYYSLWILYKRTVSMPLSNRLKTMTPPHQDIVLACLTSGSQDASILRMAQRHARARSTPWYAVYLELWDDQKENRTHARNRVLEQVALAERMGATTFVTKAADYTRGIQEALSECSRRQLCPVLLVAGGATVNSPLQVRRAVASLQEQCEEKLELLLLTPNELPHKRLSWLERLHMRRLTPKASLYALIAVAVAYGVETLVHVLMPESVGALAHTHSFLIYLIACAVVAGRFGLLPGMIAAVASFLSIKMLILPPLFSLQGGSITDTVNLALFLIAASIVSLVNSQVHAQAEASEINEWRMQALLQVYKIALHARSRNEALAELHANLKQFLHAEIAVYMPSLVMPNLQAVWPQEPNLNDQDLAILNQTWEEVLNGSEHDASNPQTGWRFEPLTSANGEIGMLALRVPAAEATDVHFNRYLHMVAELVASILEKIESTDMKEETRVRDEREKLRTSLLSSVSHDLKTPLAAILGSLSVHRSMYDKLPEPQRRELTDAALAEAQRLDSFITNILDLAKIESGAVKFKRQWQLADDLISRVKKRMRMRFEQHQLVLTPSAVDYEVELDPVTSEQALLNVLDNAIKYTEAGNSIEVSMDTDERYFRLHVRDHGRGIPDEDHERIFDKYTRLQRQDHQVAGTGLGLALARAVMRGQGGDITVATHPEGGAVFTLCWPHWRTASKVSKSA